MKLKRLNFIGCHTKILVYLYIFQFLKECIQGGDKSYDFANIINNLLGSTKIVTFVKHFFVVKHFFLSESVRKQRQSSCKYIPRATVYTQQQGRGWGVEWETRVREK